MNVREELHYYLERPPTSDEIAEAEEWQQDHPGVGLNEWIDAMKEIGAI